MGYSYIGYCIEHLPDEMRCTEHTKSGRPCPNPKADGTHVCKTHLRRLTKEQDEQRKTKQAGWIYVFDTNFTVKGGRLYKIGYTTRKLSIREQALRSANPFGKVLFAAFVGKVRSVEAAVHKQFGRYRAERELFRLPMDVLREVRDYLEPLVIEGITHGEWDV